jgi:hypothetical protein
MALYKQLKGDKSSNNEKGQTKRSEQSPEFLKASDEGQTSAVSQINHFSKDKHAHLLTDSRSDIQRANLATALQKNYGNRYVQDLLEHGKEAKGSMQNQKPANSVSLSSNNNKTTLTLSLNALVKRDESSKEEEGNSDVQDETPEVQEETIPATGCDNLLKNSAINLHQNAQRGNVQIPGTAFGAYSAVPEKSALVVRSGRDWMVTASLDIIYNWNVQGMGRIDIPNAYVDAVTEDTWLDVYFDLAPGYGMGRSMRTEYWCSDISAQHELAHIADSMQAYATFLPEARSWLDTQKSTDIEGAESKADEALNMIGANVVKYMGKGNDAPQEQRAYESGFGLYAARLEEIESRAYAEGWLGWLYGEDEEYGDEEEEFEDEKEEREDEEVEPEEKEDEGEGYWDDFWDDLWEDEEEDEEVIEEDEEKAEEPEEEGSWWDQLWNEEEEEEGTQEGVGEEEEKGDGYGEESYNQEEGYVEEPYGESEYGYGNEEEYGYGYGEEDYGYGYGYGDEEEYYGEEAYGYGEEDSGYGYGEESDEESWW